MAERVPRLVAHVDVRQFKLDPMDGFLLTRIDARLGPKELSRETGLPDFSVTRTLEKLEKLGIIEWIDPDAPPPPREKPAPPRERGQLPEFASIGLEPKYDPKELEEEVDLNADQKKRILDLYYRLDDLDHYTLLGVPKDADKKTVKRSYFELAAMTHPDRYFNKKLGSFKPKMEALFGRVTEAHDTLVDLERRPEYDAYLAEVATTRGMEAMLERALEESRKAAEASAAAAPTAVATPGESMAPGAVPSTRPAAPSGPSQEELQARRQALAKRLLGGASIRPPSGSKPDVPVHDPLRYTNTQDAMDALKRRYEERIDNATMQQARKYLATAEQAMSKNDVVSAASALQIATQFAPEDAEIAMRYQEVKNQADKLLCESYQKQAIYEERAQHWPEAARSWQKVAKIKVTDAKAHGHAAFCLLQIEGADLHQAAEHAKAAVTNDAATVQYHVTLAEIYLKAGKTASAKRSAETGLQLDPKNAHLLAVMKKAGK